MAKHCRCLLADGYDVGSLCRCSHFVKMSPVGRSFGRSSKLAAKGDGGVDGWMVVVEEKYSSSATAPAPATEAFDGGRRWMVVVGGHNLI